MASPEVYADARARLEAAALGVPIAWPNEQFDAPATTFVVVEISGDMSEPIELGAAGAWEESGSVWVHVLTPTGTGITDGLTLRKSIANLFRGVMSGPVTYHGAQMDPGGTSDDGTFYRLSLGVSYRFQDR